MGENHCDLLLLYVNDNELEGLRLVLNDLWGLSPRSVSSDDELSWMDFGEFHGQRIFAMKTGMGSLNPTSASSVCTLAFARLSPRYVVSVGVACGMDPEKAPIGTVLLASRVGNYTTGKIKKGEWIKRGHTSYVPAGIWQKFSTARNLPNVNQGLKILEGEVLCGELLIDDLEFKSKLRAGYPEALGCEMEANGIFAAGLLTSQSWIMVKGVCDFGDSNKAKNKEENQLLAASNAARFVLRALESIDDFRAGGPSSTPVQQKPSTPPAWRSAATNPTVEMITRLPPHEEEEIGMHIYPDSIERFFVRQAPQEWGALSAEGQHLLKTVGAKLEPIVSMADRRQTNSTLGFELLGLGGHGESFGELAALCEQQHISPVLLRMALFVAALETVSDLIAFWRKNGNALAREKHFTINIDGPMLSREADLLRPALKQYAQGSLWLEANETTSLEEADQLLGLCTDLRIDGCTLRLALDDSDQLMGRADGALLRVKLAEFLDATKVDFNKTQELMAMRTATPGMGSVVLEEFGRFVRSGKPLIIEGIGDPRMLDFLDGQSIPNAGEVFVQGYVVTPASEWTDGLRPLSGNDASPRGYVFHDPAKPLQVVKPSQSRRSRPMPFARIDPANDLLIKAREGIAAVFEAHHRVRDAFAAEHHIEAEHTAEQARILADAITADMNRAAEQIDAVGGTMRQLAATTPMEARTSLKQPLLDLAGWLSVLAVSRPDSMGQMASAQGLMEDGLLELPVRHPKSIEIIRAAWCGGKADFSKEALNAVKSASGMALEFDLDDLDTDNDCDSWIREIEIAAYIKLVEEPVKGKLSEEELKELRKRLRSDFSAASVTRCEGTPEYPRQSPHGPRILHRST